MNPTPIKINRSPELIFLAITTQTALKEDQIKKIKKDQIKKIKKERKKERRSDCY